MPTYRALTLLAVLALSACEYLPDVTRKSSAPDRIALSSGLVVGGAPGWCVDTGSVQQTNNATVVIFGSCAALRNDAQEPSPAVPGIISVSIEGSAADVPPVDAVEEFLLSEAGRAALSRSGTAESVDILETQIDGDTLFLHAVDRSGVPGAAAAEYWRALFDLEGRVVTVSLVGTTSTVKSENAWRAALDAQVAHMRAVNSS